MNKYIFLDIDGVLITEKGYGELDVFCQLQLKNIVDVTNAKIVISSSWRKHTLRWRGLKKLRENDQ